MSLEGADRSYRFLDGEGFGEGARRVATGRAEKAIERLRGAGAENEKRAEAIHGARKDMKKLRTLLRLLRDELPKKVYRAEQERYRSAARALAATRDAEVKLQTLERLDEAERLPGEAIASWRQILARDREARENTSPAALEEAANTIEAGLPAIEAWPVEAEGWKAIDPSLARIYRRGRKAMRRAAAAPSEANLHQWRKRVKDLRYATELLVGAWPGPLETSAKEAHRLTDLLGDHHDLALLRADLRERRLGEEQTRELEAAIDRRQAELVADALDLGARLYAERPQAFSRRLRRYWEACRG